MAALPGGAPRPVFGRAIHHCTNAHEPSVVFPPNNAGWEALLLCLLNVAADLAREHQLPAGTPAIVQGFFKNRGKLSHDDFVALDEAALLFAFQIWANASSKKFNRLDNACEGVSES